MARPKKVARPNAISKVVKQETNTLTKEQLESLKTISELINHARRELNGFDAENLAAAGFTVGQAYMSINKAEDLIDDLVNSFDDVDSNW